MSTDLADFVDLTDSPGPAEPKHPPSKAAKRDRDEPEVVDNVSRGDIMAFAAKANQKKRLTSPLSDSTGQVGNAQSASAGQYDNLWLKQLHVNRNAKRGPPSSGDETLDKAASSQPERSAAQASEPGPSGRHSTGHHTADIHHARVTVITWNVW